jgi:hypothetical protein
MSKVTWTVVATFIAVVSGNGREPDAETIARRIAALKPAATPAWTKVAWASSLLEARRLGEAEHRPVFLFSYEGDLDTGRC